MDKKHISVMELKEAIGEALANWDFDAADHYGQEQKEALTRAYAKPEMLCDEDENGLYYEISGKDIWDSLSIYAESTGANIANERNR